MSLINRMLLDLDEREQQEQAALAAELLVESAVESSDEVATPAPETAADIQETAAASDIANHTTEDQKVAAADATATPEVSVDMATPEPHSATDVADLFAEGDAPGVAAETADLMATTDMPDTTAETDAAEFTTQDHALETCADADMPDMNVDSDATDLIAEIGAEINTEFNAALTAEATVPMETDSANTDSPDSVAQTKHTAPAALVDTTTTGKLITDGLKPVASLPPRKKHGTSGMRLIVLLAWAIILSAMISAAYFAYDYLQQSKTAVVVTPVAPAQPEITTPAPPAVKPIKTAANDNNSGHKNTAITDTQNVTTITAPPAKPQRATKPVAQRPSSKVKSSPNKPAVIQTETPNVVKTPRKASAETQADHLYATALNKYKQGRIAESKQDLHMALQHYAQHIAAREMLAGLLIQQQNYSAAESLLTQGMVLAPEHHPFNFMLARLLNEQGQSQQAIAALEQALVAASDNADYLGLLAVLYQRSGQYELAVTLYQQALQLRMNHAPWWLGLAMSLDAQQQWQQAADAFQRVLTSQQLQPRLKMFAQQRLQAIQKIIGADTDATTSP